MKVFNRVLAIILVCLMLMPSIVTAFAEAETILVDGVTLSRASSYLKVGDTITLTATISPSNATDFSVEWTTSDESIATVENGIVTAIAEGNTIITATTSDGGFKASCNVYVSKSDVRNPVTVLTPDKNGGNYITDVLDEDKFMLLLPFDDNVTDVTGNYVPVAKDTVTYADGIHGKAIQFGSGYVEVPEIEFGTKSVTFAAWAKKTGTSTKSDPGLFGTQNWANGNNPGFVVFWNATRVGFNMADGSVRCPFNNTIGDTIPSNIYDGWTHIAYVVDRETKTISMYMDFKYISSMSFSDKDGISLDSDFTFKIGTDGSATYSLANAQMDDMFVYDGALSENDIKALAGYYGFSDIVPTESVSIDERAYLLVGDRQKLVATISPADATVQTIEWTTSDESVATVENGVVTAVAEGDAIITATTLDGGFKASCKVYVSEIDIRNMVTSPTPDKNSGEYITDILDEDKFMLLLPFDDNVTDVSGNFAPVAKDTVTYANGIHGKAIQFGSGYVEVPEIKFGTKTVSFATWVKKTGASKVGDPGLFGTQNWSNGSTPGFVAFWSDTRFGFNMADGTLRCPFNNAIGTVLPTNIYDGWTHIAYVLDRESKTITLYSDFKYLSSMSISGKESISLDSDLTFKIGADGSVTYGIANAQMDDFFVYDGALTESDINELAEYYGISPIVPVESIAFDRTSLYINTDEERKLNVKAFPENATLSELVWSSSNENIATVELGIIKGISAGETVVSSTNKNGDLIATCKVVVNDFDIRNMVTSPTPDKNSGNYITDVLDEDKFMLLLPFDDNVTDVTGNYVPVAKDTVTYADGIHGKAIQFGSGYVEVPEIEFGTKSVTFAAWAKKTGTSTKSDPGLFGTQNWANGNNPGFVVFWNATRVGFNMADGSVRCPFNNTIGDTIPSNIYDGWTHIAYVVDRETKTISMYMDFKYISSMSFSDKDGISLDSDFTFKIGTDGSATYSLANAQMDDMFVYDGALSENDIKALAGYYNATGITISPESVELSRKSAYICPTETIKLSASVLPENTTHKMIEWSSSDETVATVEDGVVTALTKGVADITVTTLDGGISASCRVYVNPLEIRNHVSVENPNELGGDFLTDLFDEGKFKTFLTFENNAEDVTENQATAVSGTINYDEGFYGKAAKFNQGYVEFSELTLGTDDVTFGVWLKFDEYDNTFRQDTVFSTREISDASYPGFVVYATFANITQMFSEGTKTYWNNAVYGDTAPADTLDGWVHLAYTVDRTNKTIKTYYDFNLVKTFALTDESAAVSFDGQYPLRLGTSGVSEYRLFKGAMDDFFIYDGVMDETDMQTLEEYYGLGKSVPVTGISLGERAIELDINEAIDLTASVLPINATIKNIVWSSEDSEIAVVNNGKIRGMSSGVTTITATTVDGGFVAECEVTVTDTIARFIYDNVVIIGLDGGGAFFKEADMPNVDRIFEGGATTYTAQTEFPSISCQCWGSLLHGIENGYHGLNNSNSEFLDYPEDSPYPSIFKLAYEKYPDAEYAAISDYSTIYRGMIEKSLPVYTATGTVEETKEKTVEYVNKKVPKLLFVQLDKPDAVGHQTGYGPTSQDYLDAMNLCDGYIGEIYAAYEEQGVLDSTLFIVSADHGGTINGNHGGNSPEEMNIFIGVAGSSVANGTIVDAEIRDIAAITAYALGLDIPSTWTAKVPDGVFKGVSGMERNVVPFEPSPYRAHTTEPTPSVDCGYHLTDVFDKDKFEFVLEFDEDVTDITGNHTDITTTGTITYEDGYYGKSAKFDEGYLTFDNLYIEDENITFGTWIKAREIKKFGVLFSTGNYAQTGFSLYMNLYSFGALNTVDRVHVLNSFSDSAYYPLDFYDGWMHVAVSVNKASGKTVIYKDFKPWAKGTVPETADFNVLPVTIGMDSAHTRDYLSVSLDDFFLYNGAMSDEDIAMLGEYYTAPTDIAKLDGASLVLDGQIGMKVYADVNEELTERAELKVTRVNSDFKCDADAPEYSTLYRVEETAELVKDENTGKFYTILYAPAKDMDNISFETELVAYSKRTPEIGISSGNVILSFNSYIEEAKNLAADGDEEFTAALPLIEALERYSSYAENFFNKGSLDAFTTEVDASKFTPAQKSDVTLVGAKLHSTSLLLEDNVTIRHYFEVTDLDAFDNTYDCDIEYKTKGNYIYFDIEDINAQDIDKSYKLILKDKNSNEVFTVTYSVGNYIVSALDSTDTKLVSLVNAMYDYYINAYAYNTSNPPSPDNDETFVDDWSK
ncbi:MAG: hypothetical protein E7613_05370 [Ruminococcaceae bacterium]|nr:hypothetical protein [Oscillospiraceae bacterium]